MNSFGKAFKISIFGESHGECVGILLDGVTPGIKLEPSDFYSDIERRKAGKKGTTPRIEADEVIISSGVFNNLTTGAPILLRFINTNTRSKDYSNLVTQPRPSHADFTAKEKYNGFNDYRGGGHFSGRLTLGLVAAGVVAKKMLGDVELVTTLKQLGKETKQDKFDEVLNNAIASHDSVGGIVHLEAHNVEVGLGEPYFDSLESTISHLIFSVGGVKGVSFGIGFDGAKLMGSEFNDSIINENGKTKTNNNGGINGGISNGNPITLDVFVKPTPSIGKIQETYNFNDKMVKPLEIVGRHDAAIILRAMVVLEACLAIALLDAKLVNKIQK